MVNTYEEEFGQEIPPSFEDSLVEALDSNVQLSVNKALAKTLGSLTSHFKGFARQQGWLPSIAAAAETPPQLTKPSKGKSKAEKWAHSETFERLSATILDEHGYSNPRAQETPSDNSSHYSEWPGMDSSQETSDSDQEDEPGPSKDHGSVHQVPLNVLTFDPSEIVNPRSTNRMLLPKVAKYVQAHPSCHQAPLPLYIRFRRKLFLLLGRPFERRSCRCTPRAPSDSILRACRPSWPAADMSEQMTLRGTLKGHNGWVTQIATTPQFPDMILSSSRDKSVIMWKLTRDETNYGIPQRALKGHSHFVSDVVISSDGQFALSGSWDGTLRLWDLTTGTTTRRFVGHNKDVLSVAFSADNRQIVSGSRDKTIKLWNTLGVCKYTVQEESHSEWVSCVRFSPNSSNPIIVSCGWDKMVKVWNLANCKLKTNHIGHTGFLNTVTVSPDGSLCASGGKDGQAMLWDLNEGKHLYTLDSGDTINALCFSPNRYWLCAATGPSIKIWDLEGKIIVDELKQEVISNSSKAEPPQCTSLAWSADGQTLFAGYTDNLIRVWQVTIGTR
ncbi:hypothetical protein NDU88_001422 [Pleurodeles waltl]|uniref:Small ribosomal subunit protein RACK1 n=2 Tax=Pleurodeles waltl TaxID=8319 RepID=A0AAV7Q331_PLEWA|nr:hypothetical protein NDU88_001422 [Pleurodeles waltl]